MLYSKSFLSGLPPEIRNHIYCYVLTSSAGSVILSIPSRDRGIYKNTDSWRTEELLDPKATTYLQIIPYDPGYRWVIIDEPINLSLLRVCKQTYIECKGLLWRCNTLHIENPHDIDLYERCKGKNVILKDGGIYTKNYDNSGLFSRYNGVLHGHLPTQLQMHVCSLSIDTYLFEKAPDSWDGVFRTLGRWSSLKRLTLISPAIVRDSRQNKYFENKLLEWQKNTVRNHSWLVYLLHRVYLAIPIHIEKKILLTIGHFRTRYCAFYQRRALHDKREWLATFLPHGPRQFIERLNATLGGELWIDGVLCWKNKVEICDIFKFTAEDAKNLMTGEYTKTY
jgi:hypothetical protein